MAEGGDNKEVFSLDLDTREFLEKALGAKESILRIGESSNLTGLVEGLLSVGSQLAIIGVAAFAIKEAFDLVFDAEKIKQIDNTFESMAKSSGVIASELKDGLIGAANGLADTTDILKAANKAMLTMGDSAARLPEVMELARKSTQAFGGDLIENFERMSFAISTGNQRLLKHMGITVDTKKAVEDYAKSVGALPNELSEAGRKQAIMNAALGEGSKKLRDAKVDMNSALTTMQQLKTTVKDLGEAFVIAFEKVAGPPVRNLLRSLSVMSRQIADTIKSSLGDGSEQAAAKVNILKDSIKGLKTEIEEMEGKVANFKKSDYAWIDVLIYGDPKKKQEDRLAALRDELAKSEALLAASENNVIKISEEKKKEESESIENVEKTSLVNEEERTKRKMKLADELHHMRMETLKARSETASSTAEADDYLDQEKNLMQQEREIKLAEMRREFKEKGITDEAEQKERLLLINQEYDSRIENIEGERERRREAALDNHQRKSTSAFDGIARAAEATAKRAEMANNNFGKKGQQMVNIFQKNAETAFSKFGESVVNHSATASEIMRGFFLNTLADMAQAQGQLYLAMGLVDPTKFAAGAALLTLSGILRAMAGGQGGHSGGDSGGGGSFSGGSYDSSSQNNVKEAAPQKSVTVQVMGNYFETEQTKTKLLDMIRESTDATDFKYVQIGQKG